ncbi:MAG: HAMP domain-containing protein, partial [Candidatus Aminicenantales bacterium]
MNKIFFPVFKSIRNKVALFVFFLLIFVSFIFYVVTLNIIKNHISQEVISRAESLTKSISSTAGYSFISQDLLGLDNIVFKIKNSNFDIEYIAIVDAQKKILVHSDINKIGQKFTPAQGVIFKKTPDRIVIKEITAPKGNFFELNSPIVFMRKNLGWVILAINKSILTAAQKDVQRKIMTVFALILLIGITSSILLSIVLTKPIQQLAAGVDSLKKGKRSKPLTVYSRDELGRLT